MNKRLLILSFTLLNFSAGYLLSMDNIRERITREMPGQKIDDNFLQECAKIRHLLIQHDHPKTARHLKKTLFMELNQQLRDKGYPPHRHKKTMIAAQGRYKFYCDNVIFQEQLKQQGFLSPSTPNQ